MKIKNIKDNAPKDLKIIQIGDSLYHYARVISNTRFGHMPDSIAYCKTASHIQYCITYCQEHKQEFRIRSGGHQHEGMCSGNSVVIIDLSEMDTITYLPDNEAWIPVGKQLGKVYEELETRGQIIPGGGCQSVNVGGLTQGGGWGLSIRKFGMTCDVILACEIVLADGTIVTTSSTHLPDLFKALKGGGGGNFGVVTRFKFKLCSLAPVTTSFALKWENAANVKSMLTIWTYLHEASQKLDPNLSTACGMMVADPGNKTLPEGQISNVHARMGGLFYGSKKELLMLLRTHFGGLIPENEKDFVALQEKHYPVEKGKLEANNQENTISITKHQNWIADFVNPTMPIEYQTPVSKHCGERDYRILPDAPSSTCDRPHPHKVTSGFPTATTETQHHALVESIYYFLSKTCFYSDVNRYMSFHCLGGAVTQNTDKRTFAYHNKPYLLQIQCWWDDAGNIFTNQDRNKAYVQWVADFRNHLLPGIEGAFINFVDKSLVPYPETPEGRLELLRIYYREDNLTNLRKVKSKYDQYNLFDFEMSIPPEEY